MDLDPLWLSRLQFALTIAFHILFPALTIGLASWLALLEGLWLTTGWERFRALYRFWVRIFAVSFGMGVVSGIVMSFQFGTNWSRFSEVAGNIIGPLLSYEVVTAFFLEASFLGIMLFGWNRVPRGLHFLATCMVALGTLISTFWILSANSWMQTPAGFELRDGIFYPTDWWAVVFNPSFPGRLAHMVLGAYLSTCFTIGAVAAWYLLRDRYREHARLMFALSVAFAAIVAPMQLLSGDRVGLKVLEHQPAKLAAMEGHWDGQESPVPLRLFALPDEDAETNRLEIALPWLGSLILTHSLDGRVPGLTDFAPGDRPPVTVVFWAFRLMVGLGLWMIGLGLYGAWLFWQGRLFSTRWYLRLWTLSLPVGYLAVLSGWVTAEVGRQPWVVYGLLRTADAVSPVSGVEVATSLSLFALVYTVVFGAGTYYLVQLVRGGIDVPPPQRETPLRTPERPLSAPDQPLEER